MSEFGEQQKTLYVGDLHEDVSENMLHDIFSEHGEVVTVEILSTEFGKKYAQVEMVDQETGAVLVFFSCKTRRIRLTLSIYFHFKITIEALKLFTVSIWTLKINIKTVVK